MWSASVANIGGEKYTLDSGRIVVKPNLAAATPGSDFRGPAEIAYENIVSAINRLSSREVETITVNGRTVTYKDIGSLEKMRSSLYQQMVTEKAVASGSPTNRRILTRFQ